MPDIALLTTTASSKPNNSNVSLDVEESIEQMTLPTAVAVDAGAPVYVDANGKFTTSNAGAAGTAKAYGIATRKVRAGEPVTAIAKGVLGGFNFASNAFGAPLFLSNTAGRVSDAAGTVSVRVGEVIPAGGNPRGTAPRKMLRVTL